MPERSSSSNWEKIAGFAFGVVFIAALLAITVIFPNPTPAQYATFRTILALAAAGLGGILAGFIRVEGKVTGFTVRAGGALALFALVYFFSPIAPDSPGEKTEVKQIIEKGGVGASHTGKGDINIRR